MRRPWTVGDRRVKPWPRGVARHRCDAIPFARKMANARHVARLKRGVKAWNAWREAGRQNSAVIPPEDFYNAPNLSHAKLRGLDLAGAYLVGVDLQGADLRDTILKGANLRGASLYGTDLRGSRMVWCDISEAKLYGANFSGANLHGTDLRDSRFDHTPMIRTNLSGADIRGCQFLGADLTRADLTYALLLQTVFGDTTLRATRGLESCLHEGASIIDYHTLVKSGRLPVRFLRECGLSNGFISKLPAVLDAQAPLRCFISYSIKNERLAERLDGDLQEHDIRCWYFRKHAVAGGILEKEIADYIERYDKVILICSKDSLQSAEVLKEVELALQKEVRTGKEVLVPIRIDDYVFGEWRHRRTRDVIAKTIADFRGWSRNADLYRHSFDRLFTALHAEIGRRRRKAVGRVEPKTREAAPR